VDGILDFLVKRVVDEQVPCQKTAAEVMRRGLRLVHIFAHLEPFLPLKAAKHPTTLNRKCSR